MEKYKVNFVLSKIAVSTGDRELANRVEIKYEIPRRIISEAIINAVAHRNYLSKSSIQVSVFSDRIEVSNPGSLPPELTLEDLIESHRSFPHNPLLADCLFQTGDIERYGTGIKEIFDLSHDKHLTKPLFDLNQGIRLILWRKSEIGRVSTTHDTTHDATHDTTHDVLDLIDKSQRLVFVVSGEMNRGELMEKLQIVSRVHFAKNYLKPVLDSGYLEMTIPDKPQSKNQQYRLTRKGKSLQRKLKIKLNK